jgi:putative ABC transport system substrate-binding protein
MPVIGFLHQASPTFAHHFVAAFHQGLNETGYIEGRNLAIEYRWAEGQFDRLSELAADLVRRQVSVIAAAGGEPTPQAAEAATQTIPIVFLANGDPVLRPGREPQPAGRKCDRYHYIWWRCGR